jgi:UDP-glucuronate 4-epimerase
VPFHEDDPVDHPVSPYAATKKAGELLCHTYHHLFGMRISCLRFFTVYGPRQRPEMAIHAFARRILSADPIQLFGTDSIRDYTYIDDIVDGIVAALDHDAPWRVFNLGNSSPVPLPGLVAALEGALGKKATVEHRPPEPGDMKATWADISRAKAELGWAPKVSLAEGLARFASWIRSGGP